MLILNILKRKETSFSWEWKTEGPFKKLKFFQICLLLFTVAFFLLLQNITCPPNGYQTLIFHPHKIKPQKYDSTKFPKKQLSLHIGVSTVAISTCVGGLSPGKATESSY